MLPQLTMMTIVLKTAMMKLTRGAGGRMDAGERQTEDVIVGERNVMSKDLARSNAPYSLALQMNTMTTPPTALVDGLQQDLYLRQGIVLDQILRRQLINHRRIRIS